MQNLWLSRVVSFAYQYQREAKPYKELIRDFSSLFELKGGEAVLDLGCGSGRIIRLCVEKAKSSSLSYIVGLDNSDSAIYFAQKNLTGMLSSIPHKFVVQDLSGNLELESNRFDVVTAGLSLQYAEYWDGKKWTDRAYRNVYKEIYRVLKPGGRLVFSVNTPNPDFSVIAKKSWKEIFFTPRFPLILPAVLIMVCQGRWLTKQSQIGRFHYLPIENVLSILGEAGFINPTFKLTYEGLAWVVTCEKEK